MIPPHSPDDWAALDQSRRREALGTLKVLLRDDPRDQSTRSRIVEAYRQLGHPDQAGRFAIGLDAGARREEVQAYATMVRALRADESTTRRLSVISAEVELPDRVVEAIEGAVEDGEWRSGGGLVSAAWALWAGLGLIGMAVVFGFAVAGSDDVHAIARWWNALVGWILVIALFSTTLWCAVSRKWRPALVWSLITIVVAGILLMISAS